MWFRKRCIQNWVNELLIHVTKELAGHSSIVTTQKYYLKVDEYHRAKAAAVIDSLLSRAQAKVTQSDAYVQYWTKSEWESMLRMGASTCKQDIYDISGGRVRTDDPGLMNPML